MEEACIYTLITRFDLSFPSVIFIWRFIRRFDLSFASETFICRILSLYSVICLFHSRSRHPFCHLPTSSYYVVCFCHFPLSFTCVIFTWHSESVICNLFLSLHSIISCVILLSFDMSVCTLQSMCRFAYVVLFCHVLVPFFCRFFVIFLCHCLLSCCSVSFFCRLLLTYSIGILLLSFTVVCCVFSWHFLTWTRKDMREEGRMRRRRRIRRSGLHTNSNNPTLKGGE